MYIDHVSREDTEGLYTCEVTTFPNFVRASESKRLTVVGEFTFKSCACIIRKICTSNPLTAHAADAQELKNDDDRSEKNSAFTYSTESALFIRFIALLNVIVLPFLFLCV